MKEFLIQRNDEDFCVFHISRFPEVLRPNTLKSKRIEGWGDYRIKIGDCEIAFSFEDPGIQISFEICEMDTEKAETIISEICQNVENEIEAPCYWTQISE